jgi:hypothetical protein
MRIDAFVCPDERIEHIARHGVTPKEVEEVCFGKSLLSDFLTALDTPSLREI